MADPGDPVPPPPGQPSPGWRDYQPRPIGSTPLRERRRGQRTRLVVGAAAFVLAIAVVAALLVSRGLTPPGSSSCSPSPCATDGSGFQVDIDSVDRSLTVSPPPAAGGHVVRVVVRFKNTSGAARVANPLDFKLEDAAGQMHDLLLDVGAQCGIFEGVDVAPGSTVGPKPLCFLASGDPGGKLTLLWSPLSHTIAIALP
jgi:hypothetical protein